MKRRSRDEEREQRITMEIIVDAYTPEEQAMGWYYSLEDRLTVPFVPGASPSAASRRCASVMRSRSSGWPPRRSANTRCSS
jgi:Calcium binding